MLSPSSYQAFLRLIVSQYDDCSNKPQPKFVKTPKKVHLRYQAQGNIQMVFIFNMIYCRQHANPQDHTHTSQVKCN